MKLQHLALALIALSCALPASAKYKFSQEEYDRERARYKQLLPISAELAKSLQSHVPFKLNSDMTVKKVGVIKNTIYITTVLHYDYWHYYKQEITEGPNAGIVARRIHDDAKAAICNTPALNDFVAVGGEIKLHAYDTKGSTFQKVPSIDKCP